MKLVVLRHEERDLLEPRFFTPLTEQGHHKAKSSTFLEVLNRLNPDCIFCSPFERCLQTISSFCLESNRKICVENSLYEFIGTNKFLGEPVYDFTNIKDFYEQLIDSEYDSSLKTEQFEFSENKKITRLETHTELFLRVSTFIEELFSKYLNTDKTVLLVTHEGVIKQIETYLYTSVLRISKKYRYIKMGELREFNLKYEC